MRFVVLIRIAVDIQLERKDFLCEPSWISMRESALSFQMDGCSATLSSLYFVLLAPLFLDNSFRLWIQNSE